MTEVEVMKISDAVIYLQFARDGGDSQMKKKLSVEYCFLAERISETLLKLTTVVVAERFER